MNGKILILAIAIVAFIAASGCIGGPVTVCGNGICETGETATSCPIDCGPKPGSLEVTVVSSFIGATHLSGAKVMVAGPDSNVAVTEYTNSDGIALFESLSPGAYKITASKEGYLPADANAEVVSEQKTSVRIKLPLHIVIPYCGNGACDANENITNCPVDCNTSSEVVCTSSDPSKINVKDANVSKAPVNGQKDFGIIFLTNLTGGSLATVGLSSATGAFAGNTSITLGLSTSYISSAGITLTPDEMITGGTGETTYSESAIKIEYHDYAGFTRNATITCTGPITVNNT